MDYICVCSVSGNGTRCVGGSMKKESSWKPDNLYYCGLVLLASAVFLTIVFWITGTDPGKYLLPCLFHELTGLYCPGCGGTRAFVKLLQGDIGASLHYHPIVLYGGVLYAWYMISNTVQHLSRGRINIAMKYRSWYVWVGVVILVLNTIWKNVRFLLWGQTL